MEKLRKQLKGVSGESTDGVLKIASDIMKFVIEKDCEVHLGEIEQYTGLKVVSQDLVIGILKMLINCDLMVLEGQIVKGDYNALTKVLEQDMVELPKNHNRLWTEDEEIHACYMKNRDHTNAEIAIALERTQSSITKKFANMKEGHGMIPLIQKSEEVRRFCENFTSPKPANRSD